jgi:hypothetical protein
MMPEPKFSVGEEVILNSVHSSELNGDYVVEQILTDGQIKGINNNGNIVLLALSKNESFAYILNIGKNKENGVPFCWAEKALRKKPKNDEDFQRFMSRVKLGQAKKEDTDIRSTAKETA